LEKQGVGQLRSVKNDDALFGRGEQGIEEINYEGKTGLITSATTSTVTARSLAPTASARSTFFTRTSFIDGQGTALEGCAVHGFHGRFATI
jgi:hypothetical protein